MGLTIEQKVQELSELNDPAKAYMFLHLTDSVNLPGGEIERNPALATYVNGAMAEDIFIMLPDSVVTITIKGKTYHRSRPVDGVPTAKLWDREDLVTYFKDKFRSNWKAPALRD